MSMSIMKTTETIRTFKTFPYFQSTIQLSVGKSKREVGGWTVANDLDVGFAFCAVSLVE